MSVHVGFDAVRVFQDVELAQGGHGKAQPCVCAVTCPLWWLEGSDRGSEPLAGGDVAHAARAAGVGAASVDDLESRHWPYRL